MFRNGFKGQKNPTDKINFYHIIGVDVYKTAFEFGKVLSVRH
jgi:hypothetical protein